MLEDAVPHAHPAGRAGGEGGPPPFAVVVPSDDYKGTLKELSGGKDVELKHQDGDYDAFDGPDGQGTWYAAKAAGIVAFGPSKDLIASIAKRGGKTLDSVLTGSAARTFLGGDIGVYVNAASLTKRYADQIEQARQALMAVMDQAGQQAGNAAHDAVRQGLVRRAVRLAQVRRRPDPRSRLRREGAPSRRVPEGQAR